MSEEEAKMFVHLVQVAFDEGLATKEEINLGIKLAMLYALPLNLNAV